MSKRPDQQKQKGGQGDQQQAHMATDQIRHARTERDNTGIRIDRRKSHVAVRPPTRLFKAASGSHIVTVREIESRCPDNGVSP